MGYCCDNWLAGGLQIQDILGGDKQLAQEILYDLKHDAPAASKPAGANTNISRVICQGKLFW